MIRASRVLLIAALAMSCAGDPVRPDDLVGVYAINLGTSPDAIVLHADGTYSHSYMAGTEATTQRGRWQLEVIDSEPLVTFHDFVFGREGFGSGAPALWPVSPQRERGRLRLPLDRDRGLWYDKQ